jgi:hypothetical protein
MARGPAAAQALRRLFLAAAARGGPPAEGAALLSERFGLDLSGGLPWCWPTLRALWTCLEVLPPSAVAENPALRRLARAGGHGFGAYHDRGTRSPLGPGSAEVGVTDPAALTGNYPWPLPCFRTTVHHEVGHAVAVRLALYNTLYQQVPGSPWIFQGDRAAFLRALLGEDADEDTVRLAELYLDQAPGRGRSLRRAHDLLAREARRRRRRAPSRALLREAALRHLSHNSRYPMPCYHALTPLPDGRIYCYDAGYQRGFGLLHPLIAEARLSDYQLRSPDEWFAELYALYYADAPRRPGQRLRRYSRTLAAIAAWFDEHVKR